MILNFKEIPQANTGNGNQDNFELFACDFFSSLGYEIVEEPSRGADGGMDLKLKETRRGIEGKTNIYYWLVSCKHYAHSKKSISTNIEFDISDRVKSKNCDGFIGFYSTIPSSALSEKLASLKRNNSIDYLIYDYSKIEDRLLSLKSKENLLKSYFPESYKKWKSIQAINEPISLFKYYIDSKKSETTELLISLFGSIETLLIELRKHTSLDEVLNIRVHKKLIIDPDLFQFFLEKGGHTTVEKIFDFVLNEMREYLSEKHKIEIVKSIEDLSYPTSKNPPFYLDYKDTMIVNKVQYQKLLTKFDELKRMID